jgi:tetratricopeptide (TPR) repeat protein
MTVRPSTQSMALFKAANTAYSRHDYANAASLYEQAIAADPERASGIIGEAYFFLGSCYDNLWQPGRKGEATNDRLLDLAVENYERAVDTLKTGNVADQKLWRMALDYMVAAYGADKLNDPAKAEGVLLKLVQTEPGELASYFALAKIYEDVGEDDAAENALLHAKERKPDNPVVYVQLAGFYNRQGDFEKTIGALTERADRNPGNPEAFYTLSTFYWDKAYRDFRLSEEQKRQYVAKGLEAVDRALGMKPDYEEALIYKNLLLRIEANMESDPMKQQEIIREADELRDRAQQLRKSKG